MKKILVFLAALVGGPVLIVCGIDEYKNSKKLQAEGKVITAEVVDAEETVSRKGRRKYWLTINYQPEQGGAQKATSQVSYDRFTRAINEKTVALVYLPSKPQVFQFGEKAETRYGSIVFGSILTIGALGFAGFLFVASRSSRGGSAGSVAQEPMGIPAKPAAAPVADDQQKAA